MKILFDLLYIQNWHNPTKREVIDFPLSSQSR